MKRSFVFFYLLIASLSLHAQNMIAAKKVAGDFLLSNVAIYTDEQDDWLVQKSASLLQHDIEMVTGVKPAIVHTMGKGKLIVIGSLNKSATIEKLAKTNHVQFDKIKNKWEAYLIQATANRLIIAGSDKRGTAYGVFELSKQIGVSPWYWWADVPVVKNKSIAIHKGNYVFSSPVVKYRGIFLNDEAPSLSGWAKEKFSGFNHAFYENVFELLLRLKANYMWPAMWGSAFNDDDTLNPKIANDYGIVMGTSHHEPMMRAHDEWRRYGKGKWNYDNNAGVLNEFWKKGIQRMGSNESLVTIGMRGDGDEPMSEKSNIELLENIVANQRGIIEDVTGKKAEDVPQMWALYKEVQDYYDKGMRVPDDVTLLLCDDNWGNIRKLPKPGDKPRKGGYGIYYHFDYVGGPRNYKWLNTTQIFRVWEQMHLAHAYGADQVWIVNVGDLKPMEYPISFFLDYAWNPDKIKASQLPAYTQSWAQQQFGKKYANEIAVILRKYTQYNSRRKPELLDENTYSLENYNEAAIVVNDYNKLARQADSIYNRLPDEYKAAYYQLVLYPVQACANLNEMYLAVAKNKFYQNPALANAMADKVKALFDRDAALSAYYNDSLSQGKWRHFMDQTHIGYTSWQQPDKNVMPAVKRLDPAIKVSMADSVSPHEKSLSYISLPASHFTKAVNANGITWQVIPDIGRTGDGITSWPVTANVQGIDNTNAHLEYAVNIDKEVKEFDAALYFSPTLNFNNTGLRYAVSIDDEAPQIVNLHHDMTNKLWEQWVAENIIISHTKHALAKPGKHVLKYWVIDPGLVLQKIVVDIGGVKPSYLGPPFTN